MLYSLQLSHRQWTDMALCPPQVDPGYPPSPGTDAAELVNLIKMNLFTWKLKWRKTRFGKQTDGSGRQRGGREEKRRAGTL